MAYYKYRVLLPILLRVKILFTTVRSTFKKHNFDHMVNEWNEN